MGLKFIVILEDSASAIGKVLQALYYTLNEVVSLFIYHFTHRYHRLPDIRRDQRRSDPASLQEAGGSQALPDTFFFWQAADPARIGNCRQCLYDAAALLVGHCPWCRIDCSRRRGGTFSGRVYAGPRG